jgi:hypothetical protein
LDQQAQLLNSRHRAYFAAPLTTKSTSRSPQIEQRKKRPIRNRHCRTVMCDLDGNIGFGLVAAALAPHDEPHLGGKRLAQSHRRRLAVTLGSGQIMTPG